MESIKCSWLPRNEEDGFVIALLGTFSTYVSSPVKVSKFEAQEFETEKLAGDTMAVSWADIKRQQK